MVLVVEMLGCNELWNHLDCYDLEMFIQRTILTMVTFV